MKTRTSITESLEDLPLHDAVVKSACMDWTSGELRIVLGPIGPEELVVLSFRDVSMLQIPRAMPWGPSSSVNSARTAGSSSYELELQSGDTWQIDAARWLYGFPLQVNDRDDG
jgi:hypothetical protein